MTKKKNEAEHDKDEPEDDNSSFIISVGFAVFAVVQPLANRTAPQPVRSFIRAKPSTVPSVAEIKKALRGEELFVWGKGLV